MSKILFVILFSLQAFAQIHETPDLQSCLREAAPLTSTLKPEEVLYVFDIDNTALELNQDFGSVQWYRWQQKLISENIEKDRVASTMDELLEIQGFIYQMSGAHTPEPEMASEISRQQKLGHPVLFHTSRNLDTREATFRELKRNGLLPLTKTLGPGLGYAGSFVYADAPANQRPVSFQNGIYMSAGQDKGVWLGFLLDKVQYHPKHLVFVDDELKNLTNVERAFQGHLSMTLCRYGQVDPVVRAFEQSDKSEETGLWMQLKALILRLK